MRAVREVDELPTREIGAAATPRARCSACWRPPGSGGRSCATRSSRAGRRATRRRRARSRGRSSGSRTIRRCGARPRRRRRLPRRRRQGGAARAARALDRRPPRRGAVRRRRRPRAAGRACMSRRASTSPTAAPRRGRSRPRFAPSASSSGARARHLPPVRRRRAPLRGAAFATLELREVLRAVLARFALRRAGGGADRAHAPRLGDAAPVARRDRLTEAATTIRAVSLFCRHNRLTANCPICSREHEAELRAKAPPSPPRTRSASRLDGQARRRAPPAGRGHHAPLARAADDGYRNPLVPGLRATADAERLAAALVAAAERLRAAGPVPGDRRPSPTSRRPPGSRSCSRSPARRRPSCRQAIGAARPVWEDGVPDDLPPSAAAPRSAYRAWAEPRRHRRRPRSPASRAGRPSAASRACSSGSRCPASAARARFDLLTTLDAAGRYELNASELFLGLEDDAATLAAKRLLVSGDRLLLDRRARELAEACRAAARRARPRPRGVGHSGRAGRPGR